MAKGVTKTPLNPKSKRADIRAFFKPGPASPQQSPPPKPRAKPRPTPKPADAKGKRKAIVLDDDSDLEIIEPTPLRKRATVEPVTGPSRIAVKLELDLELLKPELIGEGFRPGQRASTVGAWAADDEVGPRRPPSRLQIDEQLEAVGPKLQAEFKLEDGDLELGDDERAIESGRVLAEHRAGSETDWGDDDEGADGEDSAAALSEGGGERDWGDDEPPGGDDGGWGPDAFDAEPDDEKQDLERAESERPDVEEPVQASSKDLEVPPVGGQPSCPVCECVLASLPETQRQLHVNKCLDGPTSARPASSLFGPAFPSALSTPRTPSTLPKITKTTLKSRQPLSSLPVPALPNAFTALMVGHSESKQWKEAETSDNLRGRLPKGTKRTVPFYKWVDGMQITVDAFKYGKIEGCKAYFLSHAHSDHYQNLSATWEGGPIYCSQATSNLIKIKCKVKDKWLHALPFDTPTVVHGVTVTLLDANHCPGSCLFVFEGPHTCPKSSFTNTPKRTFRYLHCGDFRASPAHVAHPALAGKKVDACYLDTTYLDPKYCFPAQQLVIEACAALVRQRVVEGDQAALYRTDGAGGKSEQMMKSWIVKAKGEAADTKVEEGEESMKQDDVKPKPRERLLVLVGTYSIGKERIVKGIAEAIGTKIYCDDSKLKLIKAQDDPSLDALITRDPYAAQVHIVYLQAIQHDALSAYLAKYRNNFERGFTHVIGLRPTGWTYRPEGKDNNPTVAKVLERERQRTYSPAGMYPQRDSTSTCLAFGVPYSEHSSFYELTCFALSLDCWKWIPTVNVGSEASRKKMNFWFDRWRDEKKRRKAAGQRVAVQARAATHW